MDFDTMVKKVNQQMRDRLPILHNGQETKLASYFEGCLTKELWFYQKPAVKSTLCQVFNPNSIRFDPIRSVIGLLVVLLLVAGGIYAACVLLIPPECPMAPYYDNDQYCIHHTDTTTSPTALTTATSITSFTGYRDPTMTTTTDVPPFRF